MKALVGAFNQEKAFSVIVQLHRLIVYSTRDNSEYNISSMLLSVGNEDSGSDTEEEEDPFSDPEADWMTQSFQRQMNVS